MQVPSCWQGDELQAVDMEEFDIRVQTDARCMILAELALACQFLATSKASLSKLKCQLSISECGIWALKKGIDLAEPLNRSG